VSKFAESTSVPADRSRAEIEKTLQRYGADQFMYGWEEERAVVGFRMAGRQVRFVLPMPDRNDEEFTLTETGRVRSDAQAVAAWEQATRQRWRALALVVKAKLEAVESSITTFDDEFMAHIVLPSGQTAGDWLRPQIDEAYSKGTMPAMLAIGPG
jgi:hypothetical protein